MSRRSDGFSPKKDVRRSCRERQPMYKSLDENALGITTKSALFQSLLRNAEIQRKREQKEEDQRERDLLHKDYDHGYSTRARTIPQNGHKPSSDEEEDEEEEEEEEEEEVETFQQENVRKTRRRLSSTHEDSPQQLVTNKITKKRRVMIEDEENGECSRDHVDVGLSMYERIKNRHNKSLTPESRNGLRSHSQPPTNGHHRGNNRSLRLQQRLARKDVDEEEAESSNENEPKQYQLRPKRPQRGSFHIDSPKKLERYSKIDEFLLRRSRKHRKQHKTKRRDGASTDSTDTTDSEGKKKVHGQDQEKFERRLERSMQASRQRFLPINLSKKDLVSSEAVIRERLRQTGASCSDIDPMGIDSSVTFDQVGGLGAHIQSLKEVVLFPLLYPEIFARFNINPPKGVVFYGPPGTGKTLIARALANECGQGERKVAFFMRKGADCLSKWVGESERQLRVLFDQAYAMRPSIIFFDEIDGLAPVRSTRQDQIHSSIVSTLLALMDGLDSRGEVVVIGATNRLDTLDPALRRPGRFDRELKFNLPDSAARLQILEIHTKKWAESRPDEDLLHWLADSTSGYCGADLKFMCTEAVLISLRSRYPHIYMSREKLKIDPNELAVSREHFLQAMQRITPASRRDLTIPSKPLDARTSLLLKDTLETILQIRVPNGYRCSQSVHALRGTEHELEKVVRALETLPVVPHERLILCGSSICSDAGQTSFLLPALLGRLDHLPVFSLEIGRLFVDGRPEEALAQTMQAALRSAATGPAILLLPSADQWFTTMPSSVVHMLHSALEMLTGFTSLLFLATIDCHFEIAPPVILSLFRPANAVKILPPLSELRRNYFNSIVYNAALMEPKQFIAANYIQPPLASSSNDGHVRKLNAKESKELEKVYDGLLRQIRIFLRDLLAKLMRDRRFHIFTDPVDGDEYDDYYQIIKEPMCMADMMNKIDRKVYTHPDQFLADIELIKRNALRYNFDHRPESRSIRHQAVALRDMTEALFDLELDEEFVEKLENTQKLLKECGMEIEREEELPFAEEHEAAKKALSEKPPKEESFENEDSDEERDSEHEKERDVPRIRRKRRKTGTYLFPSQKRKTKSMENGHSSFNRENGKESEGEESVLGDDQMNGMPNGKCDSPEGSVPLLNESPINEITSEQKVLIIDQDRLMRVVDKAVNGTENWPVTELERLAACLAHKIDTYRDSWDRSALPGELKKLVSNWLHEKESF
ncbi:unnamed protein product, partial [Mesorhabditis belari]|uniref:Bromo domain-containing protein n=1 Tax=Mesorhabditis belari TaxID=2138241 RepID=A0AAF3J6K8_9BILA